MDGTLAVIWLLTSLTDMGFNDCPTGCLREKAQTQRLSFSAADVQFQDESISEELYIGLDANRSFGPFQPTMGGSVTNDGDLWFGAGAKWTSQQVFDVPLFVETSLMPGVYKSGDGPDIGGALQFRSAFGVGYSFDSGATLTVLYDHRSNADSQPLNPGLETLSIRYAISLE
ncbi:acyloxyacyl hydrolase [Yoonia sediminilitoris]|uniref:Lipid A 3-O-deacylase PagL n=1 Tax=Yoonia sediminilitoris TaxID=1286148 RepID=A0A2T6KCQ8_9RHOB|nr:acyloxyacyl hydrolase [Yoonia sediminilitoris]PUB12737.1 lipid A 3-O-deacylase PagL [Yoonia sediminilitoris]RCW94216.1 lipid A 3-O-deacylase PagL [Yoonia sediminilitoris]